MDDELLDRFFGGKETSIVTHYVTQGNIAVPVSKPNSIGSMLESVFLDRTSLISLMYPPAMHRRDNQFLKSYLGFPDIKYDGLMLFLEEEMGNMNVKSDFYVLVCLIEFAAIYPEHSPILVFIFIALICISEPIRNAVIQDVHLNGDPSEKLIVRDFCKYSAGLYRKFTCSQFEPSTVRKEIETLVETMRVVYISRDIDSILTIQEEAVKVSTRDTPCSIAPKDDSMEIFLSSDDDDDDDIEQQIEL